MDYCNINYEFLILYLLCSDGQVSRVRVTARVRCALTSWHCWHARSATARIRQAEGLFGREQWWATQLHTWQSLSRYPL